MGEIDLEYQALTFLLSCLLGVVFCMIYDFIRVFHNHSPKNGFLIFAVDVLYFIVLAVITYLFLLLRCLGNIRIFVFIGEAIGFMVFRKYLSNYLLKFAELILKIINKIYIAIKIPLCSIFGLFYKLFGKILKIIKNIAKWIKKHLKPICEVLYNFFCKKSKT